MLLNKSSNRRDVLQTRANDSINVSHLQVGCELTQMLDMECSGYEPPLGLPAACELLPSPPTYRYGRSTVDGLDAVVGTGYGSSRVLM